MANVKAVYGTTTAITITLASLANLAARECTALSNVTDLFLDALVALAITLGAGSPSTADGSQPRIDVYAYGSTDDASPLYTDNATGSNAALTMRSPTNLVLLGSIMTPTSGALTYKGNFNVSQAFGGILPSKWGIVIVNNTGLAFDSTEANHTKQYRGVYASVT